MHDNKELFDLAKVNIEQFKNTENYKVNGKMKDETSMKPIIEFVSLCPKVYSYITEEKNEKRNKGINTCVMKELKHDNYKNVLEDNINIQKEQLNIRSYRHQLFTENNNKICLSCSDDKMIRTGPNSGFPFGYIPISS